MANRSPLDRPSNEKSRCLLVFRIPGYTCALPLTAVGEIIPLPLLSRPPALPTLFEGFLNLAGQAIPVLRLDRLFDLPEVSLGLHTPLILLRGKESVALLVETVVGIFLPGEEIRSPPDGSLKGCVLGELSLQGQTGFLLSPERLLLEKERQLLALFRAREQKRLDLLEGRDEHLHVP